jgi:hypothetical protein
LGFVIEEMGSVILPNPLTYAKVTPR